MQPIVGNVRKSRNIILINRLLFIICISIVLLIYASNSQAWWSWSPPPTHSTHHKISETAYDLVSNNLSNDFLKNPEWIGYTYSTELPPLNDWTAHGGVEIRNGGDIETWFKAFVILYNNGSVQDDQTAHMYLGYCIHLIEDMNVPPHAFNIQHAGDNRAEILDNFETRAGEVYMGPDNDFQVPAPNQNHVLSPWNIYFETKNNTILAVKNSWVNEHYHIGDNAGYLDWNGDGPKGYYTNREGIVYGDEDNDTFPLIHPLIPSNAKSFVQQQLNESVKRVGTFLLAVEQYLANLGITGPDCVDVLQPITLVGPGKINGVQVISWQWDFNNDGNFNDDNGQTVSHTFRQWGDFTVQVKLNNDDSLVKTKTIHVRPPQINITYPDGYESLRRGFSTPDLHLQDDTQYAWDFGNGWPIEHGRTHDNVIYPTSGEYTVRLTVTLDDGSAMTPYSQPVFVGPGTRYISGHTVYNSETWYSGGTYVVQGSITVAQGATLTIEPGVVVKFANQQGISVNGTLDARGADEQKIIFTSIWDDTYGGNTDPSGGDHTAPGDTWQVNPGASGDASCPWAANYWGQITFGLTSVNSVIDRAAILYGGSVRSGVWCYNPYATGMLSVQSSSAAVTNSMVSHSSGNGIDVSNVSPVITWDTISGNGGSGVSLSGSSSPLITGCTIDNNVGDGIRDNASGSSVIAIDTITGNGGWGIGCSGSPNPSITGNIVSANGAGGISCNPSVLSGNTITGNTGPAVQQDASGVWADGTNTISGNTYDGVAITGGTLSRDTTITANNGALYLIWSTITVPEGAKLTIEPGVVVKFANQQGISVNGTLDARGADEQKIIFTSIWDDTYGGNTDPSGGDHTAPGDTWQVNPGASGDASCPWAANYWGQITFGLTSVNSVIDRAAILYGGSVRSGVWCYNPYATGMLSVQSSSAAVTNSMVSHSSGNGIDVSNVSPVITWDTISGNGGSGVSLSGSSSPLITGCTISESNGNGIYSITTGSPVIVSNIFTGLGTGIFIGNGSPTVRHNTLDNNDYGINVSGGTGGNYTRNHFIRNTSYGFYKSGSSVVDAANNYWGDPTGPYDPNDDRATGGLYNPAGLGNVVTDWVDYFPWLEAPPAAHSANGVDFDGDIKTDIAVWRPSTGTWYIQRSTDDGMTATQWGAGALNDVPVPGDYDGDGETDVAVWRAGSGVWYIQRSSDGGMLSPQWGLGSLGDITVPGDYDGDGKTDVAVWRPSNGVWYIQRSSDGGMLSPQWGLGSLGDVPVPGDYDGDGKTDVAVWRPDSGVWYIQKSSDGGMLSPQWGLGSLSDVPVPGDYDGDGKTDVAVWRADSGVWYIQKSSDGGMLSPQWGSGALGDIPIKSRY